jgi:predicted dehydrogenase
VIVGPHVKLRVEVHGTRGYDDLRVLEARNFLTSVRDREQRQPGLDEMVATARVLEAIERSAASGGWEPAR